MWIVYENSGKFHHKTDSFSMAANLAGWIRGYWRWQN